MDAKPQRPRVRVFGDENAPPAVAGGQQKTLHSRNKSSPALSTMAAVGALKPAGKRSAFGDVSNVALNRIVRDDSVLSGKVGYQISDKVLLQDKKASVLQRPAQRPLAVAAAKLAATNAVSTTKQALADGAHLVAGKNVLNKRKTTVFKDASEVEPQQNITFGSALVQHDLPAPHQPQVSAPVKLISAGPMPIIEHVEPVQYRTSAEDLRHIPILEETYPLDPSIASVKGQLDVDRLTLSIASAAPLPEIEERWDDDEDDYYEDDGYVTARSYRSRGENTTAGATTTLYPHVNVHVKREIAAAKELIEGSRTIDEIEDEAWDTSMVAEYGDEIFEYMRELEIRMSPNPHYMDKQTEIQWSMRSVLMDWVVQVHHRFALLPETLFLCVNLIDRFLSQKIVSLTKLQLVGATAIFVAAKYEEINCPAVQEVVYMVDHGYGIDEILKAERFMLSMIGFELGFPGPMSFLRRISKADDYDLETRTLAKYFLEVTIMDERFLSCPPSFTSAAAHCLARMMLKKGVWSPAHVYYSNYTFTQLHPLVQLIFECCEDPRKHHAAIYEKYLDKRYKKASSFVENEMRKGFKVPDVAASAASNQLVSSYAGSWKAYQN